MLTHRSHRAFRSSRGLIQIAGITLAFGCNGNPGTQPADADFALVLSSAVLPIPQGTTASTTVTIARSNFHGAVTLSLRGAPTGIAASFTQSGGETSSALSLAVDSTLSPGTYHLTVVGTGTAGTRATPLDLVVGAAINYWLTLTPAALSVAPGGSGVTTVNVKRINFTGPVTLSLAGAPAGVAAVFTPPVPPGATSTLTLTVGSSVPTGGYSLTVNGTATLGARFAPLTLAVSPAGTTLTVNPQITYQTMLGWEASVSPSWAVSPPVHSALIHDAVADLGITRLRVEASALYIETKVDPTGTGCGSAPPGANDDADPFHINPTGFHWYCLDQKITTWVLPLRAEVLARGEPFLMNVCYVGFDSSMGFQQVVPQEYAEFTVATLDHLRQTFGLVPDVWELRLEPDRRFQLTGPQLGQLLAATGPRIRAAGYSQLLFGAPSMANPNSVTSYLASLLAVPGAAPYLTEVVYHRYSVPLPSTLSSIASAAKAAGLRTAMLEHIGANARELYEDLTLANVSSWQRYALAGPYGGPNGGSQLYYVDLANDSYTLRKSAYELRQYFKYVRPGAVRIGASSTDPAVHPVAFRDQAGRIVTVLNADKAATITVGGLPGGKYEVSYTTVSLFGVVVGSQTITTGQTLTTSIPAAGTLTVAPL